MTYKVVQSEEFEASLLDELRYLVETLSATNAAERMLECLDNLVSLLETSPLLKAVSTKPYLKERNLREYYFLNYVVLYLVDGNEVMLVNLFHQSQDYESALAFE